jgi:adenine phosphoribosyltransferase
MWSLTSRPEFLGPVIKVFAQMIRQEVGDFDLVLGVESKGFVVGSLIAQEMKKPFVPIRKNGRLNGEIHELKCEINGVEGETLSVEKRYFEKEHVKVIVIDDLIVTGGTLMYCEDLLAKIDKVT